jgi:hypothetical protein
MTPRCLTAVELRGDGKLTISVTVFPTQIPITAWAQELNPAQASNE